MENEMLHVMGRGDDFFLLTPPPFRFVIRLHVPSDDPIDSGVLPGRSGLLGDEFSGRSDLLGGEYSLYF